MPTPAPTADVDRPLETNVFLKKGLAPSIDITPLSVQQNFLQQFFESSLVALYFIGRRQSSAAYQEEWRRSPRPGLYTDTLRWCQGSRLGYPLCSGETGVLKQPTARIVCAHGIAHAALDSLLS